MSLSYRELLERLYQALPKGAGARASERVEIPAPKVEIIGNRTIIINFMEYPKILRRDPRDILIRLGKWTATPTSLYGSRAILIGKRDARSIRAVIDRYVNERVRCPVCSSLDTLIKKERRIEFLACEACGAVSPILKS